MKEILTLPENLANQIAAGEVVERPISVVKELVENSLDAGATHIGVSIKSGGNEEIIVTDNGSGISVESLIVLWKKHSTSKISSLEDLYNVMTFWFRGEAIASIGSVSRLEITSQTQGHPFGKKMTIEGGHKKPLEDVSANQWTKVEVKDLFYNVPARLNYLKSPTTEKAYIDTFLREISLAYPERSFDFFADDKKVFVYREESQEQRIYNVFWEEFSENIIPLTPQSISGISVSGYISHPRVHFKNRGKQVIFVNKRLIKSPTIWRAIYDAYNRFIPHGSYPGFIIFIDVNPTEVDVNVHPKKQEVRFAHEQDIFRKVFHAVEWTLDSVSLIGWNTPMSSIAPTGFTPSPLPSQEKYYTGSGTKFASYSPYKEISHNPKQMSVPDAIAFSQAILQQTEDTSSSHDIRETPLWKVVWQVFHSYIVVESWKKLTLYDQHALAERIIFEKLCRTQWIASSQKLLVNEIVHLTPKEFVIFEENTEVLHEVWFEIEAFSGNTVSIWAIPDFVKKEKIKDVLIWIITDIWEEGSKELKTLEEVKNKVRAYTACRSAIKFGDNLSIFEIQALLKDAVVDYSATCPHGRPVAFEIDLDDLKWKFDR